MSHTPTENSDAVSPAAQHARLRYTLEQLADAQRIAHLGSWEWDVATNAVIWSDEMYRIYGLEPQSEECSVESYLARVHPEDRERVGNSIEEAYTSGAPFSFQERILRPDDSVRVLQSRGTAILEGGRVTKLVGTCQDITEQKEIAERNLELAREQAIRIGTEEEKKRTSFLAEAGALLVSSIDYETTLCNFAHLAVPRIADWCAVDIVTADGKVKRVVTAHADPTKEALADELARRYTADPNATVGVAQVLRTGTAELLSDVPWEMVAGAARDEEHLRLLRDLDIRSYMIVPLTARNRTLGAITLVRAECGERYDEDDLSFARELAGRAALAVENARLYAAAREARDQFRFLADSIPVQIWTARPDGALDYVNGQVAQYFGRSEEQILGEGWLNVIDPAQLRAVGERWSHSLSTGEPYEIEFRLLRNDGEYCWHLARAVADRDDAGKITRWYGSNTNIDDSKHAEAERERLISELDIERSRLSEIFRRAPAFIAILSGPDHVFETANPPYERLVGHRSIIGKPLREALPELADQRVTDLLDTVYQTGEAFVGNEMPVLVQRETDGEMEESFLNFVYQPICRSGGAVSGIFVHAVDVTQQVLARLEIEEKADEQARIARALEASNRELDQFAYVASHDLKAPLRGISNLSTWIEEDFGSEINAEVKGHLELMRGRVNRMEGLIDGILEYSRAGRVRQKPEPVDVAALVQEAIDLLAPPGEFEIQIAPGMPTLVTERLPLQQIFLNLLGNAIKYTKAAHPRVVVESADRGAFSEFSVADNGPGIAPEYHERIFGIFQMLEARDTVEGTGIGLSLVKKLVESRGGKIWVESEEGMGTTFRFLWPSSP